MLIGIAGLAGAGKDTVADMIENGILERFHRYSFAQPLKELAQDWLGLDEGFMHRSVKESPIAIKYTNLEFNFLDILIWDMFKDNLTMADAKKTAGAIVDTMINTAEEVTENFIITTPRKILQIIGTEGFRNTVRENFWVSITPTEGNFIIPDVRFENELYHIQGDNPDNITIYVKRPNNPNGTGTGHASEGQLDPEDFDYVIDNNGTLEELRNQVDDIIRYSALEAIPF